MDVVITPTTPSSPGATYTSRRSQGSDHQRAVREVAHAYQRSEREVQRVVAEARAAFEAPEQAPAPTENGTIPSHHPLDARKAEISKRIADLSQERSELALAAMEDDVGADELADVEAQLAGLEAEAEHIGLARVEADRRARQGAVDAEQKVRQKARDRAQLLATERAKLEGKLGLAALSFAEALAAVDVIAAQQARALSDAGSPNAWQQVTPSPSGVRRILVTALRQAGAPTGFLD